MAEYVGMEADGLDLSDSPDRDHDVRLLSLRARIATDIADGRRIDMVLHDLVAAIEDHIAGAVGAVISLVDGEHTRVLAAGTPASITELIHGRPQGSWFGSWSSALTRQVPTVVTDIGESSLYRRHFPAFVQHGLLAAKAAPLRNRQRLVRGALVVYLDRARVLTPPEADVFEVIAELAGVVLRRDEATRDLLDRLRYDRLTGLENRDGLEELLRSALATVGEDGSSVGLIFVDIDDLTLVNDSLGHTAGDAVISTTARRIRDHLMHADTVVRFGGDEFIVVLDRIRDIADARAVAERIRTAIAEPMEIDGQSLTTTVSIGITLGGGDTPPLQLIDEGHAAVVRAKQNGRGSTADHDRALDTAASDRLSREMLLRKAIEGDELRLLWQPKVDLLTGKIAGAEALARWNDPELGEVGPEQFVATAERAGLIDQLSEWVLHQSLEETHAFLEHNPDFAVAVNLSASQVARPDISETICRALYETGIESRHLIIELTESILAEPPVIDRLRELCATGVRSAIDDFGTGYSSLAYVQQLPVQIVKVDRAFIDGLGADGEGAPILAAAVAMAQALGLFTTVEGVESHAQHIGLLTLDVMWGQGYHFSEPVTSAALAEMLAQGSSWPPLSDGE